MITFARSMPIGNAAQVKVRPPAGAEEWVVIRSSSPVSLSSIATPNTVVVDRGRFQISYDIGLDNGSTYHYTFASRIGSTWTFRSPVPVLVESTSILEVQDPLLAIRARVDYGMASLVARGLVDVQSSTRIPVLTAPPQYEEVSWPVVTIHCRSDAAADRALGEIITHDPDDADTEGWLTKYQVEIIAWSLNPDERISLRSAIKHIILGNLPIFDALGLLRIDLQMSDMEDFQTYSAPIYQAVGTLTFEHQTPITWVTPKVRTVERTMSTYGQKINE